MTAEPWDNYTCIRKQISTTNHLLAVNFVPASTDICAGKAYSAVCSRITRFCYNFSQKCAFGVVFRGFCPGVYCLKGDCLKNPSLKAELHSVNFNGIYKFKTINFTCNNHT